jgi:uncharacterized membrane protein
MMKHEDFKCIARPNCSLSKQGRIYAVTIVAVFSFVIAAFFCFFGAWMVLPFTGLECMAVAAAFYYMQCHSNDYESISIHENDLTIERLSYKSLTQISFNRYWAKVYLRDLPNGHHELRVRSHGKEVCFGNRFLDDEQRIKLAKELNQFVGMAY